MRRLGLAILILASFVGGGAAFAEEAADPSPAKEAAPSSDAPADEGSATDDSGKDEPPKDGATDETKPHPDPRVIIDVTSKGKKKKDKNADAIQAAARRGFWGKTVSCYKLAAWSDPKLEIDVTLRVDVRGGAVKKATVQKPGAPKKKDKKKTKTKSAADEVGACLAKRAVGLAMPKGVKTATSLRVQVYPGDDPIPRPPSKDAPSKGAPSKSSPAKDKPKPKK